MPKKKSKMMRVKMLRTVHVDKKKGAFETYAKGFVFNVPEDLAVNWMAEEPAAAWKEGEEPPKPEQVSALAVASDVTAPVETVYEEEKPAEPIEDSPNEDEEI